MPVPRRVALYCRISTIEQHLDVQLEALRVFARARGLEVASEYLDEGVSGADPRRTALAQLRKDARRRAFDVVACVKLDRLARSLHQLTTIAGELQEASVDLVVLDQAIDTTTPSGRLLFHVLGAIAEFERDLIRDRTRAGLAAARRRGKRIGRPPALGAAEATAAAQLYLQGQTLQSIAARFGVGRSTVTRSIRAARANDAQLTGPDFGVNTAPVGGRKIGPGRNLG